ALHAQHHVRAGGAGQRAPHARGRGSVLHPPRQGARVLRGRGGPARRSHAGRMGLRVVPGRGHARLPERGAGARISTGDARQGAAGPHELPGRGAPGTARRAPGDPGVMQAQVLHAWGDALSHEKVPTPAPGRGEVLIRVEACGVGLTVLNYMNGNMDRRPELLPRVPGHEFVGTVAEVGPEVHAPRVGERVMAYFYLACGHCDYCRLAHEPLCRNLRGNVGVVTNGGYAEYAVLPAFNCLPVPERLSAIEATAVIDAIATPLHVN